MALRVHCKFLGVCDLDAVLDDDVPTHLLTADFRNAESPHLTLMDRPPRIYLNNYQTWVSYGYVDVDHVT